MRQKGETVGNGLRILLAFCLVFFCFEAQGELKIKEQRKLLQKYDLWHDKEIDGIYRDSPGEFWNYLRENNKPFQKALKAAQNGKAKNAQKVLGEAIAEIESMYEPPEYVEGVSELLDSLKAGSGIMDLYQREAELRIDWSMVPNAFTLPNGIVYMTAGILARMDLDYNMLMAVYAHELAHFVLQHSFTNIYYEDRRRKRNELLAGIASVVYVTAAAVSDFVAASNGVPSNSTAYSVDAAISIMNGAKKNVKSFQMKYTREQEYEADIVGYRFLESIGIDGSYYIEMLRRMKSDLEIFSNDGSTHPLTEDRIVLIEFMRTNPSFKPKQIDSGDDIYYREEW